ncbi:Piso0_000203 [Millerozyma farinosa CBS 7064]|uniref:Piso0_000203 protein n=1 Tax=Pichia sorbitophila (strain ATCC MYA-4447 / BCRC 22081 / CBS 7064 / NBRC 10061 / NRRL Y-12695) TaxID=559304 RepID=G8YUT3_PICSO|nr:Piso0_000203 [Millerozyma farinosa CBS 7064]
MARGNQRELARQKNLKKQQEAAKSKRKEGSAAKRMESDAEKMRQKQAAGMWISYVLSDDDSSLEKNNFTNCTS